MASIQISTATLRKVVGLKKNGRTDVSAIGLTYEGQPITTLEFMRAQVVEYHNGGQVLAIFQDRCWIDD